MTPQSDMGYVGPLRTSLLRHKRSRSFDVWSSLGPCVLRKLFKFQSTYLLTYLGITYKTEGQGTRITTTQVHYYFVSSTFKTEVRLDQTHMQKPVYRSRETRRNKDRHFTLLSLEVKYLNNTPNLLNYLTNTLRI